MRCTATQLLPEAERRSGRARRPASPEAKPEAALSPGWVQESSIAAAFNLDRWHNEQFAFLDFNRHIDWLATTWRLESRRPFAHRPSNLFEVRADVLAFDKNLSVRRRNL